MVSKPGFRGYSNALVKTTKLEKLQNEYCCLVLDNGFSYTGILMVVYDDSVIFMDRKDGRKKFNRDRIFCCYVTPIAAKHKGKTNKE